MSGIAQVLIGAGGAGIIGGGPAWFYIRAQNRRTNASTDRQEAETDSVIVETTNRLVGVVRQEIARYEERIIAVEGENDTLRREHYSCVNDLHRMNTELNTERRARHRQDERIESLLQEAEHGRAERVRLTDQAEILAERVTALQTQLDGHV